MKKLKAFPRDPTFRLKTVIKLPRKERAVERKEFARPAELTELGRPDDRLYQSPIITSLTRRRK